MAADIERASFFPSFSFFFAGSEIWACGLFCSDKKEMKIQSSFTKTLSSGWSDKINAQPHQSS